MEELLCEAGFTRHDDGTWHPPEDTWLTRPEVAAREKLPVATLAQWASQGRGPRYARFGRHARYRLSDLIAWENQQFGDRANGHEGVTR
jgi:hypothetical protein